MPVVFAKLFSWSIFVTFISENYGVYGVRKMWHALQRQGIDVGREHTARLMRSAGLSSKGQRWGTCHNSST
ncbi:transposase [Corynebacterium diphtheriae]